MSIPETMRAVEIAEPGPPEALRIVTRPTPRPGPGEVLVRVAAAGINRADVMQREGRYPPPPGASDLPGLELSGTVAEAGPEADPVRVGRPGVRHRLRRVPTPSTASFPRPSASRFRSR